jgi:hypothetical protein
VAGNIRLPSPGKLQDLAAWCAEHFRPSPKVEDTDA